jgi:hypothetical protein
MKNNKKLSQVLAIIGTALVWLPVAAMLVFGVLHWARAGEPMFDFFLPAEALPLVLVGFGLLLWAALREKFLVKAISLTFGIGIAGLVLSQSAALLSGLADGSIGPSGFWFVLVIGIFSIYDLAVIWLGVLGVRLTQHLLQLRQ